MLDSLSVQVSQFSLSPHPCSRPESGDSHFGVNQDHLVTLVIIAHTRLVFLVIRVFSFNSEYPVDRVLCNSCENQHVSLNATVNLFCHFSLVD